MIYLSLKLGCLFRYETKIITLTDIIISSGVTLMSLVMLGLLLLLLRFLSDRVSLLRGNILFVVFLGLNLCVTFT
jgi:hypothetical protein